MEKDFDELTGILKDLSNIQGNELLTRANANMSETLLNDIMLCFEKERSPDGKKWAERKDKTNQNKLLYNTGDLNNFDTKVDTKGFFVFNNRGVAGKNNFHYGLSHQFGAFKNGKQIIPERPFLPIKGDNIQNAELNDDIKAKIKKELEDTIKRALKIKK